MAAARPVFSWMRVTEAVIIGVIVSAASMFSAFAVMQNNIDKLSASVEAQISAIAQHDALPAHREQRIWNNNISQRLDHMDSTIGMIWRAVRARDGN